MCESLASTFLALLANFCLKWYGGYWVNIYNTIQNIGARTKPRCASS